MIDVLIVHKHHDFVGLTNFLNNWGDLQGQRYEELVVALIK